MQKEHARIVDAMDELRKRRNSGQPIHVVLVDVAEQYDVPECALRQRAEASWGIPLENDRERNAAHFEYITRIDTLVSEAAALARKFWHEDRSKQNDPLRHWNLKWKLHLWLREVSINDGDFQQRAEDAFQAELYRLDRTKNTDVLDNASNH